MTYIMKVTLFYVGVYKRYKRSVTKTINNSKCQQQSTNNNISVCVLQPHMIIVPPLNIKHYIFYSHKLLLLARCLFDWYQQKFYGGSQSGVSEVPWVD